MAEHLIPRAPTTAALLAALRAKFLPILVGDGAVPLTAGGVSAKAPYAVLLPLWSNLSGPPYGQDRHADAEWVYQLSLYGLRGDQIEGMRDKAFGVVLGKTGTGYTVDLDTDEVKIMERDLKEDNGVGEPSGSVLPLDLRFSLHATPADALVDD